VAASQGKLYTNNARGPGNQFRAGKILVQIKFPEVAFTILCLVKFRKQTENTRSVVYH
jgi:hypothetical protein